MTESKTKSDVKKDDSTTVKEERLRVFNFTRDGVVVRAKNRKEAEKLFKERNKGEDN